nr:MAG TPA: hypothetical protein [Bacteriophage sp.]
MASVKISYLSAAQYSQYRAVDFFLPFQDVFPITSRLRRYLDRAQTQVM